MYFFSNVTVDDNSVKCVTTQRCACGSKEGLVRYLLIKIQVEIHFLIQIHVHRTSRCSGLSCLQYIATKKLAYTIYIIVDVYNKYRSMFQMNQFVKI